MPRKKDKKKYLHEGSDSLFSLSKFVDKKVVDLLGYPGTPFNGMVVFVISEILFEDGSVAFPQGERDSVYLHPDATLTNMNEEALQSFIEE